MADINDIWDDEEDDEIIRNMNPRRSPAMTDPAPSVQPVRAWAVVDKNGTIHLSALYRLKETAERDVVEFDYRQPTQHRAPHRVIRVEIREVNDE